MKMEKDVGGIFPLEALCTAEVIGNSAEVRKIVGTSDDKTRKNFESEKEAKKWAKKQMKKLTKRLEKKEFEVNNESLTDGLIWR